MLTINKVEIEPRQPALDRKPDRNPSVNPGYIWLDNPPPWLEIERGDSSPCTADAAARGAA
jgi:hypothetical protein